MVHSRSSVQHTRGTASTPQQPPTPTPQQQPSHAAPAPARDIETPPLCEQVLGVICKGLEEGTYSIGTTWPVFSEAWWWEVRGVDDSLRCGVVTPTATGVASCRRDTQTQRPLASI